jgi:hypothetical protein
MSEFQLHSDHHAGGDQIFNGDIFGPFCVGVFLVHFHSHVFSEVCLRLSTIQLDWTLTNEI